MNAPGLLAMGWRDVLFAHYRADAARVAASLPRGIELDVFQGTAWLSVVAFRLERVRLRVAPIVLPGFADVPELNLRTYVRVGSRRGVYFFNLDAASTILIAAARTMTALPYFRARMHAREDAGGIAFEIARSRSGGRDVRFRARYRPIGGATVPRAGTLEAFLHDRFAFFTPRFGGIALGEISHGPWQLGGVDLRIAENSLGDQIGHPLPASPDLATFSRGVDVLAGGVVAMPHEAASHGA